MNFVGLLQKLSIAPETTPGTKATTGYVALHAGRTTLKPMRRLVTPSRTGRAIVGEDHQLPLYCQGQLTIPLCLTETVVTEVLQLIGNIATNTFTFGDGSAPDQATATIRQDYGGTEWAFTGCTLNALTLNLPHDGFGTMVLDVIGMGAEKETTPSDPTAPADSLILGPSDYNDLTVGGTALGHKGITVVMNYPHTGAERYVAGASNIRQPIPGDAPQSCVLTIGAELDDETGYDTESILDAFLNGTDAGAIAVETDLIAATGGPMTGDWPDGAPGIQDVAASFKIDALTMALL